MLHEAEEVAPEDEVVCPVPHFVQEVEPAVVE